MRKPDFYDGVALIGLAMVGYGIYLISLPAAWIVVGAALILLGVLGARKAV